MTDDKLRPPTIKEAAATLRARMAALDGRQPVWNQVQTVLSDYDLDTYQGVTHAQERLHRLYGNVLQLEVALTALISALGRKATALNPAAPDLLQAAATVLNGLNARIETAPSEAVPVFDGIAELAEAVDYYSEKEIDQ